MTKNDALLELNSPFCYEEYKVNYEGFVSVGPQSVADRLNAVFGIYDWTHDILEYNEDHNEFTVSVRGVLKVRDPKTSEWVTRTQFGDKKIVKSNQEDRPKAQAFLDAKKSAVSDSLKKCAALYGVASDVYKGKIQSVRAKKNNRNGSQSDYNEMYLALAQYFQIDFRYNSQYEHGIVILPEEYRGYYERNNWSGVFENDKKAAWDTWLQRSNGAGNHNDHELSGAASSSGSTPPPGQSHNQTRTDQKSGQSATQKNDKAGNNTSKSLEQQMYEFIDIFADAHPTTREPYFRLTFKHQGKPVEIFAVDSNVMNFIDRINPREGNRYTIKTTPGKNGKLILKHLRSVS